MNKILISEQESQSKTDGFTVKLSFNDTDEFSDIKIYDPFNPIIEDKLDWHFENYISFPYLKEVEPQEVAEIIQRGGENLFTKIFSRPEIYSYYQKILSQGINNLVIEIAGSPEFHSLHWESLKDPKLPKAFALDVPILRKDLKTQTLPAIVREASTINLLLVTARPYGNRDVSYRTISRPLVELIRKAHLPVKIDILRPNTFESLIKHLDEITAKYGNGYYHIIHFDVHGGLLTFEQFENFEQEKYINNLIFQPPRYGRPIIKPYDGKEAFLFFDYYKEPVDKDDDGFRADLVRANELTELLLIHGIPIVILNACQSAKELGEQNQVRGLPVAEETSLASRLMRSGAQMVLAMSYSITVTAAEILMKSFYQEIFSGKSLQRAIQIGRKELSNRKERRAAFNYQVNLEDWLLPVLYQKQNVELKISSQNPQQEEDFYLTEQKVISKPELEYGFHGRDIDILSIERLVLYRNNILLIQGMGGAGKTTLLKHLSWWWQVSNFVKKVFYFGYDEKAYTRQEIMHDIAKTLYDKFEFATFQAMDENAQQQKLTRKLRTERHLVILDNLESISGGYFATKNNLSSNEQEKLKIFISELWVENPPFSEQTIVLLGSRGTEEWLSKTTFRKNIYELKGLDIESATQFAEEVLRQNQVLHYREDQDFKKFLNILEGFPLPIEILLENLKRQTPTEILSALKAGEVNFSTGTAEERTKNILKCIEYSHRNISTEKQDLLLCLAPFTSVINRQYFNAYIEELKKHKALTDLKHELWDEVFDDSIQRGLMLKSETPSIVNLHPILPFFLKTQWMNPDMAVFKEAVQAAFREYYNNICIEIMRLLRSNNADEKLLGQTLAHIEFENIETSLEYDLSTQTSFFYPYSVLMSFFETRHDTQARLDLNMKIWKKLESFSPDILTGELEHDFIGVLDSIGNDQLLVGQYTEAENTYKKVLEYNNKIQSDDIYLKKLNESTAYHQLGNVANYQRDLEKAEKHYQKALKILNELKDPSMKQVVLKNSAVLIQNLGILSQRRHDFENAEKYIQQALEISVSINDIDAQSHSFFQLGRLAEDQRQFGKAINYYQKALDISIKFNDLFDEARILHQIGTVLLEQRNFAEAEEYYQRSLEIYIKLNDRASQATSFHQLGRISKMQNKLEQAEKYYQQALQTHIQLNNKFSQGTTLQNLGVLAQTERNWEVARAFYQQALEIFIELGNQHAMAGIFNQLGNVEFGLQNFEKAELFYKQALEIFNKYEDQYSIAGTTYQLGLVAKGVGDFNQAKSYYLQSLEIFKDYQDSHRIGVVLGALSILWRETKDRSILKNVGATLDISVNKAKKLLLG